MAIAPGLDGTDTTLKNMAVRYALAEAPALVVTATSNNVTSFTATANAGQGIIVSPNLTTNLSLQLTLVNSFISSADIIWFGVQNGSNTAAVQLSPGLVTVANGSCTVLLNNINTGTHNGTVQIAFDIIKMISTATSPD